VFAGRPTSVWNDNVSITDYPELAGEVDVDVAVVGGGIAGVTTALLLKLSGKRVALLEARRVGRQVTGHSNAKITSLHSLIYADLIARLGEDAAGLYGEAHEAAIRRIAEWVDQRGIGCDFERRPAYTFTQRPDRVARIEAEYEAATELGLPASLHSDIGLPYGVQSAIRFDDQAQFNPTAYVRDLAASLPGDQSFVFERTRVLEIEQGDPCTVRAESGIVRARDVVVATNLPVIPEGEFHKKASPRAHLVVAARIEPERAPGGMYLSIDPPTHSVRTAASDGGRILIVVGESFAPGHVKDTAAMYRKLRAFARDRFGVDDFVAQWANMDYDSQDRLPFIGRAAPEHERLWVATGFCSWGITGGTVAGMVLADALTGRDNPWAELFAATRQPGEAENRGQPPMRADEMPEPRTGSFEQLGNGEAAVFQDGEDEGPVAAWRDDQGELHLVAATCTHLGCQVQWNNGNGTWDCPCHGSTFEPDGTVIHGPATQSLKRVPAES
jgi:glycine/D-amino acid oxidase-like deaminating enzyme/nitrite reductase/ring-hydroxylating ferredoxin subunit